LLLERFFDEAQQLFRRVRFADEMVGATLDRLDRVIERIVRGEDDHLCFGMFSLDLREHVEAFCVG
jgi:hypothetical protein